MPGKWTTYRKMADEVVDNAVFVAKLKPHACITKQLSIGSKDKGNDHLSIYGNNAQHIRQMMMDNSSLKRILHSSFSYTQAEVEWFVQNEMAMTVEDVLARRTRMLFLDAQAAIESAPVVAEIMATIFKKDKQWIQQQITTFTEIAKHYCLN